MNSVVNALNNKFLVAAVCGLFVLSIVKRFAGR